MYSLETYKHRLACTQSKNIRGFLQYSLYFAVCTDSDQERYSSTILNGNLFVCISYSVKSSVDRKFDNQYGYALDSEEFNYN